MRSSIPDRRRRPVTRWLVACCAAALIRAVPAPAQVVTGGATPCAADPGVPTAAERGTLRSGDLLTINIFRQKELSGPYVIDPQGRVVIPGLGDLHAAGLSPSGVEGRLKALLSCRGFQPEASVQAQIRVSVLGEVRSPGLFPVDPGMNVLQIITLAGGQLQDADLSKTRIMREGRSYNIDLGSALSGQSSAAAAGVVLQSGDVVLVPRRTGFTQSDWAVVFSGLATLVTIVNVIVTLSRR